MEVPCKNSTGRLHGSWPLIRTVSFEPWCTLAVHEILGDSPTLSYTHVDNIPISLMSKYLTVKEAMKLVGKSESTIKRLLREITKQDDHEDRDLIQPSHSDVEERRKAREPYIWKISSDLLEKRYPKENAEQGTEAAERTSTTRSVDNEIIAVLRDQLESKDRQIQTLENQLDKKDVQISNQHERMRETNTLMRDLQQRLVIAAPPNATDIVVETTPEKGTVVPANPSPAKKKQSIWKRSFNIFGSQS